MPTIPSKIIAIAERRLGTLDAYYGPAEPVIEGFKNGNFFPQRIRTLSQTKGDEITVVVKLLHQIQDTAIIVHGARGCSSAQHFFEAFDGQGAPVFSTNLTEDNSIMGAEAVLRDVIQTAFDRHKPKAIFVVTTPIVAINNDDVQSVAAELGEELAIPIIPIYSDGFKTKTAGNGYDIAFHALAGYLVPEAEAIDETRVNLITSVEQKQDVDFLIHAVSALGLKPNLFPRFQGISNIQESTRAAASIGLRPESRVLGEFLEKERSVPFSLLPPPVGTAGTSRWLAAVAEKYGRQKEAAEFISLQEKVVQAALENTPELNLAGKKVYISGEAVIALALADLIKDFGGEIAGLTLASLDKNTAVLLEDSIKKNNWQFNLHIGDGQVFEQANILFRLKPDLYLGELGQAAPAAKLGIPSVCYASLPIYGYAAGLSIIRKLAQAYANKSFVETLAAFSPLYSYTSWFSKNPNWYIKQEVG
jgi:nitrogenase molybdenum-iron protein alpha chain